MGNLADKAALSYRRLHSGAASYFRWCMDNSELPEVTAGKSDLCPSQRPLSRCRLSSDGNFLWKYRFNHQGEFHYPPILLLGQKDVLLHV